MTDAELGWVAGILDGEGCISLNSSGHLTVQVSNCDARIIQRLVALAGGHFYQPAKTPMRKPTHSPLFQWHLNGRAALALLRLVLPLLVGKADQAELALEWKATDAPRGVRLPVTMRADRERIRVGLKALKETRPAAAQAAPRMWSIVAAAS